MRVCLGIPVVGSVPGEVYHGHLNLACSLGRKHDVVIPGITDVFPHDRARGGIAAAAIKADCDYLFFVDSDMNVPDNSFDVLLDMLLSLKAQMTCGHYYRRGYPYTCTWSKIVEGMTMQVTSPPTASPVLLDATGLACNVIDLKWCAKHLPDPWFYMGPYKGGYVWEDAYFCHALREVGGTIYSCPSVRCGHLSPGVLVNDDNNEQLRRWHMQKDNVIDLTSDSKSVLLGD